MNKLQIVATRALKVLGTFELNMQSYAGNGLYTKENLEEINVCDTSFCLAGYLAHEDKYPCDFYEKTSSGFEFDHFAYSCDLVPGPRINWEFFFSCYWPSDVSLAEERMQFVVKHGHIPTNFDCNFSNTGEWL